MSTYRYEKEQPLITQTGIESFAYSFMDKAEYVSAHLHSAIELLCIENGEFDVYANDRHVHANVGDVVLFCSNTVHRVVSLSGKAGRYWVLKFSPALIMMLSDADQRATYMRLLAYPTDGQSWHWTRAQAEACGLFAAFEAVKQAEHNGGVGGDIARKIGAGSVILSLVRSLLSHPSAPAPIIAGDSTVRRIYDVTEFISTHYAESLTASQCAAYAYMSYSYFSRTFLQVTGKNFSQYLTTVRLNHAEHAILCTEAPITQIAQDCGFSDCSYFISVFKKHKGITPLALRHHQSL